VGDQQAHRDADVVDDVIAPAVRCTVAAVMLLAGLAGSAAAREIALPEVGRVGRVTVRAEDGAGAPARRIAAQAGPALDSVETDLPGLPHVAEVEVRVVRHAADLAAIAPPGRGAPTWAIGVAYPDLGVVVLALRARDGSLVDVDRTLTHELAHLALGRALGGREPRWLTEGFAYLHSADFSLPRMTTLAGAVWRRELIPLGSLEAAFPAREDEAALAYAEAYDFVAFLARRGRYADPADDGDRDALRWFLADLAAGLSPDAAALEVFGRDLHQLEDEWRVSLRERLLLVPLSALGGLVWVLGAVLLVAAFLRRRSQRRRRLAAMAEEEAPKPPAPASA
jgi:hypothetical protein